MQTLMEKISSRKFLLSLAAFLGSLGAGIAGLVQDNAAVAIGGGICMVVSAAIYSAVEAYTDGKALSATQVNLVVEAKPDQIDDTKEILTMLMDGTERTIPLEVVDNVQVSETDTENK